MGKELVKEGGGARERSGEGKPGELEIRRNSLKEALAHSFP